VSARLVLGALAAVALLAGCGGGGAPGQIEASAKEDPRSNEEAVRAAVPLAA
jgi:hypothetical protein